MKDGEWRDALSLLFETGWDAEEIEGACDALNDACASENVESDLPVDMSDAEVEAALGDELTDEERDAFRTLAMVHGTDHPETAALRSALWEIDEE